MKKKIFLILMVSIFIGGCFLAGCGNGETDDNSGQSKTNNAESTTENDEISNEEATDNGEIVELNLGHVNSPDNHYHAFATKFAELANEKSNGTIQVNVFPQAQLGGEVAMFQGAQEGSIDMLIAGQSALTNTIPELAVFDLPYLFDSVEQANEILNGELGQKYLDIISEHNVKGLGYLSVIQRNIYANKPINNLDDLKGFKIRTAEAPAYMKAYESLGAQPTPMAFDEVYLSLQQGVVDGGEGSPDNYVQDKMVEVAKYYIMTKMHYLPAPVIMSQSIWDGLTPDQQTIIQESVNEALPASFDNYKNVYDKSLEEAIEADAEIIEPDLSEFREAVEPVYDELLKDIPNGQELFEELQEATSR